MAAGRVQVDELRGDYRLQPTPIQSDTFVQPAQVPVDNNYARLADALSSFSGSLGRLAQVTEKEDTKGNELALMAEQKRFAGMTMSEQAEAVKNGTKPNYTNDFVRKGMEALYGSSYGQQRDAEIKNTIATTHDFAGDPDELYAAAIKEDMEKFGSDPNFVAQYLRQMDGGRGQARGIVEGRKVDSFEKETKGAAFVGMDTVVNEGLKQSRTPEQIASDVMGSYNALGKDGVLLVNYEALDQERLNLAARIAATKPEVALELISAGRKGRNGATITLGTDPATADRVLAVQGVARKAIAEGAEKTYLEGIANQNMATMQSGNLDQLAEIRYTSPVTGEVKVVSVEKQTDDAIFRFSQESPRIAEANREAPNERVSREMTVYRRAGRNMPEVEKRLSGMWNMASASNEQDPETKAKIFEKLDGARWLRDESTQSYLSHMKDPKDRDFAETFFAGEQYLGMDKDEALSFATRATKISTEGQAGISPQQRDDVARAVNSSASMPGFLYGTNDVSPANSAVVYQRITSLSLGIMNANGVGMDKAIEMASAAVKKTSTSYNGVLLDMQGIQNIPDNFTEVVDDQIAEYVKKMPLVMERNGIDVSDLSIVPAGSSSAGGGKFLLVHKDTLSAVKDDAGNMSFITVDQVRKLGAKKETDRKNKLLRENAFNNSIKQGGFEQDTDTDGKTYWYDKKTKAIVEPNFPDGAGTPTWKPTGKRFKNSAIIKTPGNAVRGLLDNQRKLGRLYRETAVGIWDALPELKIGDDAFRNER